MSVHYYFGRLATIGSCGLDHTPAWPLHASNEGEVCVIFTLIVLRGVNMRVPMQGTVCQPGGGGKKLPTPHNCSISSGYLRGEAMYLSVRVWCVHSVIFQRSSVCENMHMACMLNTHIPVDENSMNTTLMLGRMWAAMVRHICTLTSQAHTQGQFDRTPSSLRHTHLMQLSKLKGGDKCAFVPC